MYRSRPGTQGESHGPVPQGVSVPGVGNTSDEGSRPPFQGTTSGGSKHSSVYVPKKLTLTLRGGPLRHENSRTVVLRNRRPSVVGLRTCGGVARTSSALSFLLNFRRRGVAQLG